MRTILAVCGVVLYLSEALAAGGSVGAPFQAQAPPRTMTRQTPQRPSAAMMQQLRKGLSMEAQQSLAGTITYEQQLQMLTGNATMSQRVRNLKATTAVHVTDQSAWTTGVTLTPFTPIYPPQATSDNFRLRLMSDSIWFWPPWALLPHPTDNPLLRLQQDNPDHPFLTLEANWPQPGAYLITFFLRDFWETAPWPPRVQIDSAWYTPIVPNQAAGADRWTLLCNATDPAKQKQVISLFPDPNLFGFAACYLSKIVVTRMP